MAGRTVEYRGYTITTRISLDGGITVTIQGGNYGSVKPGNTSKQAAIEWAKARIDERAVN